MMICSDISENRRIDTTMEIDEIKEAQELGGSPLSGGLDAIYNVPCNGCKHCCRGDAIRLLPSDDKSKYKTEPHPYFRGELMLAHKPNGDCCYLESDGCGIHADKPQMCKEMDCRNIAKVINFTQARKLNSQGKLRIVVWQKGKELLRSNTELIRAGSAPNKTADIHG